MRQLFAALSFVLVSAAAGAETLPIERLSHVHGLAFDRASGKAMIATHHGVWSLDENKTSATRVSATKDDFMGFTPHPREANVYFGSGHPETGGNMGLIRSNDGGKNWKMVSPGLGGPVDFHQMTVSPLDANLIFGVFNGLQVSRDGGKNWVMAGRTPKSLGQIAASAKDKNRLYGVGDEGLMVSTDGGASWGPAHISRKPASTVHVTADGTVYAVVVGSGLIRVQEPNFNWETVSAQLDGPYLFHLAVDPKNPLRMMAVNPNGRLTASEDGGKSWKQLGR